ncbi:hypothetical protein ACNM7U_08745 [Aerococcus viridans]
MFKLESVEKIKGTYDNKKVDWDRYNIEITSPVATKEYTVNVDFINKSITGDCIKYGSRYILESEECIDLLKVIVENNKPLRDFSMIIEKIEQA